MRIYPVVRVASPASAAPPPLQDPPALGPRPQRRRRLVVVCSLAAIAVAASVWAFRHIGVWLVVQDPLAPAHAIVVLSGGMPYRAREAARLYRQNFAAQVWVSQPDSPREELGRLGIAYLDESFYSQKVLIASGVPSDAIRVLKTPAANTKEEVTEIAGECRREEAHNVIIVTSKAHTRRVRFIWHRLIGHDPEMLVRYVTDDSFEPTHWWRSTTDALDVVREFLGLANAGLGFPLGPEPR